MQINYPPTNTKKKKLTHLVKLPFELNSSIEIFSKQSNIQVSLQLFGDLTDNPSSSTVENLVSCSTFFIEKYHVHRRNEINFNLLSDPLFYLTLVKGKPSTDTVH